MKLINKLRLVVPYIALSIAAMAPSSHSSNLVTDAELALLPEYCQARLGKNEMARENWSQRMGAKNFLHVHHYCFGLNYMNQAMVEFDQKRKKFLLQRAIAGFNYVLQRWPKEFSLTPAAAMYRQQAEMMLSLTR